MHAGLFGEGDLGESALRALEKLQRYFLAAFAAVFFLIVAIGVYRLGAFAISVMSPVQAIATLCALALRGLLVRISRHSPKCRLATENVRALIFVIVVVSSSSSVSTKPSERGGESSRSVLSPFPAQDRGGGLDHVVRVHAGRQMTFDVTVKHPHAWILRHHVYRVHLGWQ